MRLAHAQLLESRRGSLGSDDVRRHVGAVEQLDLTACEPRVVDVGDDPPGKERDLLVVGGEQEAVAAAGEPEEGGLAKPLRRRQGPVLEPPQRLPVGDHDQVAVEPVEPPQQLLVARVVVASEPDAVEADPLSARRRSER